LRGVCDVEKRTCRLMTLSLSEDDLGPLTMVE
jgi:hypothetical protein